MTCVPIQWYHVTYSGIIIIMTNTAHTPAYCIMIIYACMCGYKRSLLQYTTRCIRGGCGVVFLSVMQSSLDLVPVWPLCLPSLFTLHMYLIALEVIEPSFEMTLYLLRIYLIYSLLLSILFEMFRLLCLSVFKYLP